MKKILFFLLLLSFLYAPIEESQCCENFDQYVQGNIFTELDSPNKKVYLDLFYDNKETGKRDPIQYTPVYVYIMDHEGGNKALVKLYTDEEGSAIFDFSNYAPPSLSDPIEMKFFYCPIECSCMNCLDAYNIPTSEYGVNSPEDLNNIFSPDLPTEPQNPQYILPFYSSVIHTPPITSAVQVLDFAICLPLIIIFALLGGSLYLSGRNPFAGFDFSAPRMKKIIRYRSSGRGVYFSWASVAMGAFKAGSAVYKAGSAAEGLLDEKKDITEKEDASTTTEKGKAVGTKKGKSTIGSGRRTGTEVKGGLSFAEEGSLPGFNLYKSIKGFKGRHTTAKANLSKYASSTGALYTLLALDIAQRLMGGLFGNELAVLNTISVSLTGKTLNHLIAGGVASLSTDAHDGLDGFNGLAGTSVIEIGGKEYTRKLSLDGSGKKLKIEFIGPDGSTINISSLSTELQEQFKEYQELSNLEHNIVGTGSSSYLALLTSSGNIYFDMGGNKIDPTTLSAEVQKDLGQNTLAKIQGNLQLIQGFYGNDSRIKANMLAMRTLVLQAQPQGLTKEQQKQYNLARAELIRALDQPGASIDSINTAIAASIAPNLTDKVEINGKKYERRYSIDSQGNLQSSFFSIDKSGIVSSAPIELSTLSGNEQKSFAAIKSPEIITMEKIYSTEQLTNIINFTAFNNVDSNLQNLMGQVQNSLVSFEKFNPENDVISNLSSAAYATSFGASFYSLQAMEATDNLDAIKDLQTRSELKSVFSTIREIKVGSAVFEDLTLAASKSLSSSLNLEYSRARASSTLFSLDPSTSLALQPSESLSVDLTLSLNKILKDKIQTKDDVQSAISKFQNLSSYQHSTTQTYDMLGHTYSLAKMHELPSIARNLAKISKFSKGNQPTIYRASQLLTQDLTQSADLKGNPDLSRSLKTFKLYMKNKDPKFIESSLRKQMKRDHEQKLELSKLMSNSTFEKTFGKKMDKFEDSFNEKKSEYYFGDSGHISSKFEQYVDQSEKLKDMLENGKIKQKTFEKKIAKLNSEFAGFLSTQVPDSFSDSLLTKPLKKRKK